MMEFILKTNIKHLVKNIEKEFDTRVLEFGITKRGDGLFEKLFPFGLSIPEAAYMGYLFIPIDDMDNIITNKYHAKYQEVGNQDMSTPFGGFAASQFSSILKSDLEVCDFIRSQFKGGNIYNIGAMKVSDYSKYKSVVQDIDKIEDVRYRLFSYFVNNKYVTL